MKITLGHTPDADDAFMFYGMLAGNIHSQDFVIEHTVQDIEKLNHRAKKGDLDVTAASVHACAYATNYTILRSGGSFGIGYGPIVAALENFNPESVSKAKIAIPGRMTSAFLLLQMMIGKFEFVEMNFSDIPLAISNKIVDAGLIIHEAQITYQQYGIVKILDTGEWWNDVTGGLPVPLGVNIMKRSFGKKTIQKFDEYLQKSIEYGLENAPAAVQYSTRYGRNNPVDTIDKFVKMYVNPVTVDMGVKGEEAIHEMFRMAREKKLVPDFDLDVAPPHTNAR